MPPPPRNLDDKAMLDFLRKLLEGNYRMQITKPFDPFLAVEGGWFFEFDNKVFVVWLDENAKP